MKILYIVSTLRLCGPTNQLFYIIKYLDSQKFKPVIFTLSPEPQKSLWSKFKALDIEIHSLNLSRLQGLFKGGQKLEAFVDKLQPDVIHSQGIRPDTLAAKYSNKYRTVATIRNYPDDDYGMKYGKVFGYYLARRHISAFKKIKLPVSCSATISEMLDKHGVKSQVVCNGVDEDLYKPATPEEKIKLKQKLNLPEKFKIIVSVGALIPRKQPDLMIRGFSASQAAKNTILLILGEGTLLESCQEIANNSSNIQFRGQVSNVVDYLKVADYFVSASLSEGLPNSVIEALACSLPVCLSDIKPHQEILNLNQQAGITFQVGNVEALTTQLDKLLHTQPEPMSIAARQIVSEHLNARKMSAQYQDIYSVLN